MVLISRYGGIPKMKSRNTIISTITMLSFFIVALVCYAAYTHQGEIDSQNFGVSHPQTAGTKLDSCTLCHRGGSYSSGGKTTTLGSCQWCHYTYGYNKIGKIDDTLNSYGQDYLSHGRNAAAITAIQDLDSDGDGYPNKVEIAALRYPGDPNDDPAKVAAPFKVFTRDQLEKMPQHNQFLLMNASKSTDSYVEYTGVPMEDLLKRIVLPSATDVMALSPDGFAQTHPFAYDSTLNVYYVNGTYPSASFYYNEQADVAKYPKTGWCDYSAPSAAGRINGDLIINRAGLKMLLALKRDGQYLAPGVLNTSNKLDGEGPFRIVPPQKVAEPPDQRSTATNADNPGTWVWPYQPNGDHNAGFSTRSATIMKVGPLPEGTTDINLLEAGWDYIDQNKIVVYGAINPLDNIKEKLALLQTTIDAIPKASFRNPMQKSLLKGEIELIEWFVRFKGYDWAYRMLQDSILARMNGCTASGYSDKNDWFKNCDTATKLYWAVNEITVLLRILV
jgi:hypothetical protein